MSAELSAVTLALRALSESELHGLTAATKRVPTTLAPGLIAWFLAVLDWELNRRVDHHNDLAPPAATIPLGEEGASLDAAIAMRATFARHSPPARALFDALVDLLTPRTAPKRDRKPLDDRIWLE
jgi:hypothetical protein